MSLNENLIENTAAKKVMSRIALKIDTWENWQKDDAKSLVLHAGEVAFVQMGTVPPIGGANGTSEVLFKVGDGTTTFENLPWASAKAADVYSWAKKDENAFKTWLSGEAGFATDAEVAAIQTALNNAIAGLGTRLDNMNIPSIEGLATVAYVNSQDAALKAELIGGGYGVEPEEGEEAPEILATTIAQAANMAKDAQTSADNAQVDATSALNKVDTLIGNDASKSVRTIASEELAAKLIPSTAKDALNTLEEIAAWIQNHPDDAAELNRLLSGLGTTGEGEAAKAKTVKEYVDGAVSAETTARGTAITTAINAEVEARNSAINAAVSAESQARSTAIAGEVEARNAAITTAVEGEASARSTAITSAINALEVDKVVVGASKTLVSIEEVDGKIATEAVDIAITKSQITDFKDSDYAEAGHNHDDRYANKTTFDNHVVAYNTHVGKAVTNETYLLIDCGSSTLCID